MKHTHRAGKKYWQRCLVLWVSLLWLFSLPALAKPAAYLVGMEIKPAVLSSQFIFILTKKTPGRVKSLSHPPRVILELQHTSKHFELRRAHLGGANVTSIQAENMEPDGIRFIFNTKGKVRWSIRFLPTPSAYGARLQLTLTSTSMPLLHQAPVLQKKTKQTPQKINRPVSSSIKKSTVLTVVIDPGHGGKDSGARGPHGLEEKKVVLAIAKRLRAQLNQMTSFRVVLTRERDEFVPLRTRLKLARQSHADLFVAVHADAYFNHQARGASVYALSSRGATSEAARWLAERDNYSELGDIEFQALQDRSPMLRSVLIDLAQTVTIQDSLRLGNKILDALEKVTSLHYRQVEQARFVVLKSPDIPSILVETGFISHPEEEKRLADPLYQDKVAGAMAAGIQQYVKKYNV